MIYFENIYHIGKKINVFMRCDFDLRTRYDYVMLVPKRKDYRWILKCTTLLYWDLDLPD